MQSERYFLQRRNSCGLLKQKRRRFLWNEEVLWRRRADGKWSGCALRSAQQWLECKFRSRRSSIYHGHFVSVRRTLNRRASVFEWWVGRIIPMINRVYLIRRRVILQEVWTHLIYWLLLQEFLLLWLRSKATQEQECEPHSEYLSFRTQALVAFSSASFWTQKRAWFPSNSALPVRSLSQPTLTQNNPESSSRGIHLDVNLVV